MSRLRTLFHSPLAASDEEVIAVGLVFRGNIPVRASAFVGCRLDGRAASLLSPHAMLVGCAFDAVAASSPQAVGTLPLSHPRLRLLEDADPATRERALEEILEAGDLELLPILCSLVTDAEWLVRSLVLQIATKWWQPEQPAADVIARTLTYALGDEHSMVQMAAQDFVQRLSAASNATADVVGELTSPLTELRMRALRALIALHRIGREAALSIDETNWKHMLGDASPEVRLAVLDALAQIDHHCPLSLVATLTTDQDSAVRDAATQLLEEQSANA